MGWLQQLVASVALLVAAAGEVGRPRGVPLSRASLYDPTRDFTCMDGSSTIPFSQVNDDYCDCFDGSDEPGTSACINGAFHCANAGHKAQNVPSSRVNDGVCDCCDGTDEYREGGRRCPDTCEELGRIARAEAQRRAELLRLGGQLRAQLAEGGRARREQLAAQLATLDTDLGEAESLRTEREAAKKEREAREEEALARYHEEEERQRAARELEAEKANEREARESFTRYDADGDGTLTLAELQAQTTLDKNRDGAVDDDEARYFLAEREAVDVDIFVEFAWPLIKPFLMSEEGLFISPILPLSDAETDGEHTDAETDNERDDEETKSKRDDVDSGDEEENDQFEPEEETEAEPEMEAEPDTDGDEEHSDADEKPPEEDNSPTYDPVTQEVVNAAKEARKLFHDADRSVRKITSKIQEIKQTLETDYGPQHEFLTLDKTCLEHEDKEYVYKLCLFDKVTQRARSGGHEVNLGSWGEWVGAEGDRYSAMKYAGGQSCWNGPNRNTHVTLDCGVEARLVAVSEPSRCEYLMELQTPAACDDSRAPPVHPHDEL